MPEPNTPNPNPNLASSQISPSKVADAPKKFRQLLLPKASIAEAPSTLMELDHLVSPPSQPQQQLITTHLRPVSTPSSSPPSLPLPRTSHSPCSPIVSPPPVAEAGWRIKQRPQQRRHQHPFPPAAPPSQLLPIFPRRPPRCPQSPSQHRS